MSFLLDTSVLCEALKPRPGKRVLDWLNSVPVDELYISVLPMSQLAKGLAMTPERDPYQEWLIKVRERLRGFTLATRNSRDFEGRGVKVFNPWTD